MARVKNRRRARPDDAGSVGERRLGAGGRPARVLVVEGDRHNALVTASVLGERYDVVVAGSGREALAVLRRERDVDVIVCDVLMPEMSGMELFETLVTLRPELRDRFLFMTGEHSTQEAREFLAQMTAPFLMRPFSSKVALDAVAGVLRSAEREAGTPRDGGQLPGLVTPRVG